ncbi:hypothetical protein SE18_17700 [Herpetosiphon geysericola]|uniref:Uncharacterized protein n=1 Tax=Herpetosiphon geysericola TaxID=70996 RepID=A0A0P6YQS7_9CHLR|nr:hypothetical protein SE18_17700 [Herpetosiphon geysericola]
MKHEAIGFGLPERHQKNLCNLWLKIKSFVEFVAKTYPSCSLCSSWIKPLTLTQRRREKNGYWLLAIGFGLPEN